MASLISFDSLFNSQIAMSCRRPKASVILAVTYVVLGLLVVCMPVNVAFVLIFLPALLLFVIVRPIAGLVAYVVSLSLTRLPLFGFDIAYSPGADTVNIHQLFLVLAFLGWLVNLFARRDVSVRSSFIYLPTLVLVGYAMFTIIWAPNVKVSLLSFAKIVANILALFLIIQLVDSEKKLKALLAAFVLAGITSSLFVIFTTRGLLGGALGLALQKKAGIFRVYGLMENTEGLAALLNQSFFVLLGVFYTLKSKGRRIILLCMGLLMFFCLVLTFSRGWLIGFVAGMSYVVIKKRDVRAFFLLLGFGILAVVMLGVSGEILEKFLHRFTLDIENLPPEDPRIGRLMLFEGAWKLFLESYGIGIGLSGFPFYIGRIFPIKAGMYPHSLYLSILVELGVVGVVLFVWWVSVLVNRVMRALKASERSSYHNIFLAWCAGLISFAFNGFFRLSLAHNWWAYVGLGIVIMSVGLKMDTGTLKQTLRKQYREKTSPAV